MTYNLGNHHQDSRRRVHKNLEVYPHPNIFVHRYDVFMYFVGIGVPVLSSAQVFHIYLLQSATGVSVIAWLAYLFNSIAWLVYGFIHKEKPIIYTNIVCTIINVLVVVGVFIYS